MRLLKEEVERDYLRTLEELWKAADQLITEDPDEVSEYWGRILLNLCQQCSAAEAQVLKYERESRYKYNGKGEVVSFS